ncbi:unnamed protein product [Prorocentrum cordatum]|uniref:Uncharacterized protein n=1 Tax=Prorocentrum cordatum TaxID=2364126 RepID=A0ABN9S4R9_9DINO|nr:unnamed protein product [Polarella glacialis]
MASRRAGEDLCRSRSGHKGAMEEGPDDELLPRVPSAAASESGELSHALLLTFMQGLDRNIKMEMQSVKDDLKKVECKAGQAIADVPGPNPLRRKPDKSSRMLLRY